MSSCAMSTQLHAIQFPQVKDAAFITEYRVEESGGLATGCAGISVSLD